MLVMFAKGGRGMIREGHKIKAGLGYIEQEKGLIQNHVYISVTLFLHQIQGYYLPKSQQICCSFLLQTFALSVDYLLRTGTF